MDTWSLPMRARKDRSPLPRAPVFLFVRIGNRTRSFRGSALERGRRLRHVSVALNKLPHPWSDKPCSEPRDRPLCLGRGESPRGVLRYRRLDTFFRRSTTVPRDRSLFAQVAFRGGPPLPTLVDVSHPRVSTRVQGPTPPSLSELSSVRRSAAPHQRARHGIDRQRCTRPLPA